MSALDPVLRDYLSLRRSLGNKLEIYGYLLTDFLGFLDESASPFITTKLALTWATRSGTSARYWTNRLDAVRGFASYVQTIDPRTEIPPPDLLPRIKHRRQPYIYSDAEAVGILAASHRIREPFHAQTYCTVIGLLASTGMRVGEAIALDQTNLNTKEGILIVRNSKFGKSREVPLHPTMVEALERYAASRKQRFRWSRTGPFFFVSITGNRLTYSTVRITFIRLLAWAGLADRRPQRPRIHDLRHTFAARTLIHWYEAGLDVERQLPLLSTYLGHVSPRSTYWYLSAVPELMGAAVRRLEEGREELP